MSSHQYSPILAFLPCLHFGLVRTVPDYVIDSLVLSSVILVLHYLMTSVQSHGGVTSHPISTCVYTNRKGGEI